MDKKTGLRALLNSIIAAGALTAPGHEGNLPRGNPAAPEGVVVPAQPEPIMVGDKRVDTVENAYERYFPNFAQKEFFLETAPKNNLDIMHRLFPPPHGNVKDLPASFEFRGVKAAEFMGDKDLREILDVLKERQAKVYSNWKDPVEQGKQAETDITWGRHEISLFAEPTGRRFNGPFDNKGVLYEFNPRSLGGKEENMARMYRERFYEPGTDKCVFERFTAIVLDKDGKMEDVKIKEYHVKDGKRLPAHEHHISSENGQVKFVADGVERKLNWRALAEIMRHDQPQQAPKDGPEQPKGFKR